MIWRKDRDSRPRIAFGGGRRGTEASLNENEFRQIIHNLISSLRALVPDREGQIKLIAAAQEKRSACDGAKDNGKRHDGGRSFKGAGTILYKKSINGTGLGLSIVKGLVESNGGTMHEAVRQQQKRRNMMNKWLNTKLVFTN